ncbi:putative BEST plant protein match is: (TAIR:plant.1) protein [Senna tora]|uniref:Putative BEST plant protein match is: (TAIR:plant.1) protein n=1 Tax=Senna tora TaxID=362788 RepID=A0A834X9M8_9FABA|nr:putative BEST plant protein match is: (TAIR:plant.1) protein [Senna tora]
MNMMMKKQHEGNKIYREAPVSSDFEFCVKNNNYGINNMVSADQVFSQGILLPHTKITTTLRDELLLNDDVLPRLPKSSLSLRWKERLGFRRTSTSSSSSKNNNGFVQTQ